MSRNYDAKVTATERGQLACADKFIFDHCYDVFLVFKVLIVTPELEGSECKILLKRNRKMQRE